jgi:hypothetical protein
MSGADARFRRELATALAIACAAATAGCGILGSGGSSSSNSSRAGASATGRGSTPPEDSPNWRPGAHAYAQPQLKPVSSGAPGSAAAALYRYAVLYGNLCSCSQAVAELNKLAALATPALAAHLRQAAANARVAVARGLPEQARAVASVDNVELAPPKDGAQTGLVVLVERTIIHRRRATGPRPVVYMSQLANTTSGWRVASFTPVRSNR